MKKALAISLSLVLMLCMAACSAGGSGNNAPETTDAPEDALTILSTVWSQYGDDEKFPVAGGDFSEENSNMEGPGRYSIADADAIDAALGFPAASIADIDDAASLTHMMNANTFTCGVFHVTDAGKVNDVANAIKDNISVRQWMCGFPERLVISTVDNYVIVIFGNDDIISVFNDKLMSTYATQSVCDEPIL